jgi:hypothetical protein
MWARGYERTSAILNNKQMGIEEGYVTWKAGYDLKKRFI